MNKGFIKYLKVPIFLTFTQIIVYFISKFFLRNEFALNNILDDSIPFIPYFIYFYILWYVLLFLVPIIYMKYDTKALKRYIYTNFISVLICGIIFIIFPTTLIRPNIEVTSLTTWLVNIIYFFDTPAVNCFPSIHCLICFIFILCNSNSNVKRSYKAIINALSIIIIFSTFFVKQHVIYDALMSFIISSVVYIFVTKKEIKISFLSFLHKKQ